MRCAHCGGAQALERTVVEETARADVVQLEDRVTIACENDIAR
jgi:hypothetical protein